jgi:hypothetical protein
MKIQLIIMVLGILLTGGTTLAQCNDDPDEICIFWSPDPALCLNCAQADGESVTAWSPGIILMSVQLLPLTTQPWCFGLRAPTPSSLPNSMGYVDGLDPGTVIPLLPCTGDDGAAIACLNDPNCPPPVSSEPRSWGTVKGAFR